MTDKEMPTPPNGAEEVLSKYLLESIPKQNEEALEILQEWINELVKYQQQPHSEKGSPEIEVGATTGTQVIANLSEAEKQRIDFSEVLGTYLWRFTQCSDDSCRCTSGRAADLHGPYLRRHYLDEFGHYALEHITASDSRYQLVQDVQPKPAVEDVS
jgi:hypothetical protein